VGNDWGNQIRQATQQLGRVLLFSGLVKPQDMLAAMREHEAFAGKIVAILNRQRPADVADLLTPQPRKDAYPNVAIVYFYFPLWLARFDPGLILDLAVNINSYRYQRNAHEHDVEMELIKIRSTRTGIALMRATEATRRTLSINPYFLFSMHASTLFPAYGFNALTVQAGGNLLPLDPSDATIFFTPQLWGPQGTSGYAGPGSNADEILFHEIVHGSGIMSGGDSLKLKVEDLAVVLANIYLAEKKQRWLRADHDSFRPLPNPEAFLTNGDNLALLRSFRRARPAFFDALAGIPESMAWWNPVRELKQREP
jgi:hypothetical protein